MASVAQRLVPSLVDGKKNFVRDMWDRLHGLPGGKAVFSRMIGTVAPYTGTINATIQELRPGYARLTMEDKRNVRNHLRCVHAVALANLVELTGNVALAYSLPDDARFIPTGMSIEWIKKSRGRITGLCECPIVDSTEERDYDVPVVLKNEAGETVVTGTLKTRVGPKPK